MPEDNKVLLHLAAKVERQPDAEGVWDTLREGLGALGFDHLIYITCAQGETDVRMRTTLVYAELPDLTHFDPFLKYCCSSFHATHTGAEFLDDYAYLDEASRGFIRMAAEQGFRSGIALPVRLKAGGRYGGFNLGTALDREAFLRRVEPMTESLRALCLIAHRRFTELEDGEGAGVPGASLGQPVPALTRREADILFLLSLGQSRKQMAEQCGLSVNTVSDYVKTLYAKLGVSGAFEAVAAGRAAGLIAARRIVKASQSMDK